MYFYSAVKVPLRHDAPYAWFLRDGAEYNPNYRRQQLHQLDERLEAFLQCLIINENLGESVLNHIRMHDWGAVFTVATVALVTGNKDAFLKAVEAINKKAQSHELSDALRRVPFDTAKPFILDIAHHTNPWVQVAVVRAVGHHFDEINPDWLLPHLNSELPAVPVAALRVIGDKGLTGHAEHVKSLLDHEDDSVRFQAAFSGNLLGIEGAYETILPFCFTDNPYMRKALGLVHHLHDISAIKHAIPRIQDSQVSVRIKAYNIAMAGLVEWIPILLEWMKDPEYAPLAGEAFCFITGADLLTDDLIQRDPEVCESHEAPLAQKRKQDPWTQAYEEDLPWPDPEAVTAWWEVNQHRFQPETRYLAGKTLTEDNLCLISEEGTQPQRHQADLVLRLYHAGVI
ncbi:MAG: hypothetical protein KZQ81_19325 [Candidatus Thiodiazotropha sp. (ex Rostrolucina anterorostrata)]|nr:hypothetical protein [Candidatus Thiodiazotropha sp. (ex Rostrolucina anterorostrata)]